MAIKRRTAMAGGAALWVAATPTILRAQPKVHVSHGMAMHGDVKYAANAATPDYVNPNAPKGGSAKFGVQGSFDSLHPFSDPRARLAHSFSTISRATVGSIELAQIS